MKTMLTRDELLQRYRDSMKDAVKTPAFPHGFVQQWDGWSPEARDKWIKMRFAALYDPLALADILNFDFQKDPHRLLFAQFPQKQPGSGLPFYELSLLYKKFMILYTRGLFKTTAVIVDAVQTILNYPNIRVCFLTGGDTLAKRQLARVKSCFEKPTDLFLFLFPEFCLKSVRNMKTGELEDRPAKFGNAHEFTVPARTKYTFAEPTFAISTARSVKAGSHFDLIYVDDLVNDQNYDSPELLEKCWQQYLAINPLLNPGGFLILTGTRYSFDDTYERISEKMKQEEKDIGRTIWRISIKSCWTWGCRNCEHSSAWHDDQAVAEGACKVDGCHCPGYQSDDVRGVLFPATKTRDGNPIGHTLEFLDQQKRELGDEFFGYQYENNPIATGSQTFTEPLIAQQTFFDKNLLPKFPRLVMIVGDLAYSEKRGRDYSVLLAVMVFQGNLFAFDCDFGNWDSDAIAQHTVDFILKIRPHVLYYEKFLGWEAYNNVILNRAQKAGLAKMPLQWLPASNKKDAKRNRIGAVKGELNNRRLWLYAGMPGYDILTQQLLKWPKLGRHDDFADTLGMILTCPTGYETELPPANPNSGAMAWWKKITSTNDAAAEIYPDNGAGSGTACG